MNINTMKHEAQLSHRTRWFAGILFTFVIATLGYFLAKLPGFQLTGQLASAIFIAIVYRQVAGYPELFREGITFSSKKILRFAIVLYGIKLNVGFIVHDGLSIILMGVGVILFSFIASHWLSKLLKADRSITTLLAAGTGICGAAAIAAVAPIFRSKDEDTAIGVGIIALFGTIFSVGYTVIRPLLSFSPSEYGVWAGISLHEVAHVALAAAPAGEEALAMALLAKLGRVFLLVPVCLILIYLISRKRDKGESSTIPFPWFLVGFVVMSLVGTYVLGPVVPFTEDAMQMVNTVTTWCLTAAMVGLGLNVSLKDLKTKALRPVFVLLIVSTSLSTLTYVLVKVIY
ncbi:YeiH family protein [Alkalihalobacillus sp. CinArs1]|uniref:YeiH family protein n=1 Tax=Alkalihalobacillus sp. CinArs1 TaxID=2995314 RepID=UPI0022DDBF92|nr:putative sulfate exporter family transporter [Alkalihalobacillus sp. CinArs1]